jgi:DNA-binding XRE family transcriptional regulator
LANTSERNVFWQDYGNRKLLKYWGLANEPLAFWETDRVYPAWAFQPRLITYLGYDPFTDPTLGSPRGNETSYVAFLSIDTPVTLGQKMKQNRLKLRKTRKQMAAELGVSVKTLWGWETDRWQPSAALSKFGRLTP